MICKVSDFRKVVCVASEGEPHAKIQARPDELDWRFICVEIDFSRDAVLSQ